MEVLAAALVGLAFISWLWLERNWSVRTLNDTRIEAREMREEVEREKASWREASNHDWR